MVDSLKNDSTYVNYLRQNGANQYPTATNITPTITANLASQPNDTVSFGESQPTEQKSSGGILKWIVGIGVIAGGIFAAVKLHKHFSAKDVENAGKKIVQEGKSTAEEAAKAKPEVKAPEVKPEVKPVEKPLANVEVKPEPKAEVKPEEKVPTSAEAKPEVKPEAKPSPIQLIEKQISPEELPEFLHRISMGENGRTFIPKKGFPEMQPKVVASEAKSLVSTEIKPDLKAVEPKAAPPKTTPSFPYLYVGGEGKSSVLASAKDPFEKFVYVGKSENPLSKAIEPKSGDPYLPYTYAGQKVESAKVPVSELKPELKPVAQKTPETAIPTAKPQEPKAGVKVPKQPGKVHQMFSGIKERLVAGMRGVRAQGLGVKTMDEEIAEAKKIANTAKKAKALHAEAKLEKEAIVEVPVVAKSKKQPGKIHQMFSGIKERLRAGMSGVRAQGLGVKTMDEEIAEAKKIANAAKKAKATSPLDGIQLKTPIGVARKTRRVHSFHETTNI